MRGSSTIVTVTLNPAIDRTLTVRGFAAGKVNRVSSEQSHAAGKGVNVAVMLADLSADVGVDVVATGFLGDQNSATFETLFADKHIEDQFIRIPGQTRVGIKIVDGGKTTDINFPGLSPTAAAQAELAKRVTSLAKTHHGFIFCGSVPTRTTAAIYSELIEIVRAAGKWTLLDTSGAPLAAGLEARPEIAKPNVAELSELAQENLSSTTEVVAAARRLLIDRGVKLAVVSMGADGAVFVTADQALLAEPPEVPVVSTVGAGDAMVAGIAFGRANNWSLEEIATLASSLGTYAVTRIGTGLDRPDAYQKFAPRLKPIA